MLPVLAGDRSRDRYPGIPMGRLNSGPGDGNSWGQNEKALNGGAPEDLFSRKIAVAFGKCLPS
jgi:hypothetical protein